MKQYQFVVLLVMLLVFISFPKLVAQTSAQAAFELDPGTTAVRNAQLGVQPQLSQTIGDTTVNLNWAYADAFRIILNYTVTNRSGVPVFHNSNISLSDSADSFFMSRSGGGGGFINGQGTEYTFTFGIGLFETNPAPMALHLELSLEALPQDYMGGGGGFGVGPWSPEMNPNPGIHVDMGAARSANPFTFDFSLPVLPATHLELNQTVVANNLAMQIQSLDVTPSLTHAIVCVADTRILAGGINYQGQIVRTSDATFGLSTNTEGQNCSDLIYPVSTRPILNLTIERLLTPNANEAEAYAEIDRANYFEQVLAEEGIIITVTDVRDGVVDYRIDSVAEGVDANAIIQDIWNSVFADVLMDPWVFQVNVGD